MPPRSLRQCKQRGCKKLTRDSSGYCETHRYIAEEKEKEQRRRIWKQDKRESARKRGYDSAWERLRKNYLREYPLCQDCLERGILTPATEVHHKKKVKDYPRLRLDWNNLRSLCKPCHNKRTARGE